MHGLIFKTKESHRQDQSESFVIYICIYKKICICFFSQQVKWNHFIMTSVYNINITFIFVVSSRRNKTNPHHRNKFIPVFNATHLQAFKPKLSTYDQLLKTDQQDVSLYMCVRKLKHFQPHSLLCHSWCILFAISSFFYMIFVYDHVKSWRSSFDKLFFSSYTIYFILLNNCINTVILAEPSLHHNIILEKLDHSCVSRICTKIVISESRTTSLLHI